MTGNYFGFDGVDKSDIKREKAKARELRKSRWWQQKTSTSTCYYCGKRVPFKTLTMDHLLPIAMGGRSTKDNLVPSCKACNNKKKAMMPIEWQEYLDKQKK